MKNLFVKLTLIISLILNIGNGTTLNLTTGMYEATPTCASGVYNETTKACESPVTCVTGTLDSNGNCSSNPLSAAVEIYDLLENKSASCNNVTYDYKSIIPETKEYFDKEYEITLIPATHVKDVVSLISTVESIYATTSCPTGYIQGSISNNANYCEYQIDSTQCPSGLSYNTTLNKCEDYDNGTSVTRTGTVIDYIDKTNDIQTTKVIATGNYTYDYWNCDSCGAMPVSKVIEMVVAAGGTGPTTQVGCTYSIFGTGACYSCSTINCNAIVCDSESCSNQYSVYNGVVNNSAQTVQVGVNSSFINVSPGEIAVVGYKMVANASTGENKRGSGKPWINLKSSTTCQNWVYRPGTKDYPAHYYCADTGTYTYSCPSTYSLAYDTYGDAYCVKGSIFCPAGYSDNGANCKQTVSYNFYSYSCPTGYVINNNGYISYTKSDPDLSANNVSSLSTSVNSSTPPVNNCYKSATLTCTNGGTIKDVTSTIDACSLDTTFSCPSGYTKNGLMCDKTLYICPDDYELNEVTNKCEKDVYTCPAGYEDAGGYYCKIVNLVCPAGTVEVTGKPKECEKTIAAHCPIGYSVDPSNSTQCRKEIFNANCTITATCIKGANVCPENSYPSIVNNSNVCISAKEPTCGLGFTYNAISGKCETEALCPSGYLDNGKDGCIRNYTYSVYSCPTGFEGPLDAGIDCQATCGSNGCECNATTPPANNCKKPYSLTGNEIEITKKRDLVEHIVSGGVTPKEYGAIKNFDCGENCLFTVEKIIGKDNQLCFYKENGQEQCITVNGCGFKGEIANNTYPNDLFDLNVDNQYTLSLGNVNPEPAISNNVTCPVGQNYNANLKYCEEDRGLACPAGSTYNSVSNVCDRISPTPTNRASRVGQELASGDTWNGLNWGSGNRWNQSSLSGYGGCAGAGARNIQVKYFSDTNIQLTYTLFSDYNDIGSKTVTVTRTTDFSDSYSYGRDIGQFRIDFNTGIVYSGYCKGSGWSPSYTLEGIGTLPFNCSAGDVVVNGRCIKYNNPSCADSSFTWSNVSRSCYKGTEFIDSYIESTCKMNGHIGWHSRDEGIISIIKDPNNPDRMLFWDSYKDKNLGFLEFVKDVSNEDRAEGYLPENNFLYDMLGQGFTASDAVDGNTLFVSGKEISDAQCTALATKNSLVKATLVSDTTKESVKRLSGDRYQIQYQEPKCPNGIYLSSINKCINDIKSGICVNGNYDFISSDLIWDNTQGDNITIYQPFYAPYDGIYYIELTTNGSIDVNFDNVSIAKNTILTTNTTTQQFYMLKGFHEIKVVASKNVYSGINGSLLATGSRGFKVKITNKSAQIESDSNNWCKNTSSTICPTSGFSKVGNVCVETSFAHCPYGSYDASLGKCVLQPKCVLAKAGEETFREQQNAIKKETRNSADMAFKCSPLACSSSHQCQTADCPVDANGVQYQGSIIAAGEAVSGTDCVSQSCDANKPYYGYCGKQMGCDTTNPLIYEDTDGTCKELYCATGYIMDTTTKRCKKLECPEGTTLQADGSCRRL